MKLNVEVINQLNGVWMRQSGLRSDEFHNGLYNVHCIVHRVKTTMLVDSLGPD